MLRVEAAALRRAIARSSRAVHCVVRSGVRSRLRAGGCMHFSRVQRTSKMMVMCSGVQELAGGMSTAERRVQCEDGGRRRFERR